MNKSKDDATILVADQEETVRDILESRLRREGYDVETAENGQEALKQIRSDPPDLSMLGVHMPYMKGPQVLDKVREDWDSTELPVMIMVDRGSTADMASVLESGANDCIEKPIDFNVTLARIRTELDLVDQHEKVKSLVQYDTETLLFNRDFLMERLDVELSRIQRHGGQLMVMVVEILASEEELSDNLLEEIAEQLTENFRQTDVLGRYDDNEFGLVLPETKPEYEAIVSRRLMKILARRGLTEKVTFYIGTATTDTGEPEPQKMFETAEQNKDEFDLPDEEQDTKAS